MSRFGLRTLMPTGSTLGFWDGHDPVTDEPIGGIAPFPTYAQTPEGVCLRKLRTHFLGQTLREAAEITGLTVVEISNLERGVQAFEEWDDWWRVGCLLWRAGYGSLVRKDR